MQTIQMTYTVSRDKMAGQVLVPHRNKEGRYIVSKTRFQEDQEYPETLEQVLSYLQRGYKLRMSPRDFPGPASLINLASITLH